MELIKLETNKLIDLHTHTNCSDGELSPDELINLAINKNIDTVAITDHDTLEGIKSVDKDKYKDKIRIINGIELSAKRDFGTMHILGYDIDIHNENLNKELVKLKDNSINYILSIYEQIKKDYNIVFTYDDIRNLINSNHKFGRPDLAKLCIKYNKASTVQEAFDKYLIPAYDKVRSYDNKLSYTECIDLIKESNGIPVLAHPKTLKLNNDDFIKLLEELITLGLKGIEVYNSCHTLEEIDYYKSVADRYNLLISGGSDYHGKLVKPDVKLGTGTNNNTKIRKLSILDEINRRH